MASARYGVQLSQKEVSDLASLTHHPGYEVFIKIMHLGCQDELGQVSKIDPSESGADQKVLATQKVAFATKSFFDKVCNTVDWEIAEMTDDPQDREE